MSNTKSMSAALWYKNLRVLIVFAVTNPSAERYKSFPYAIIYSGIYWFKWDLTYIANKDETRKHEDVFVDWTSHHTVLQTHSSQIRDLQRPENLLLKTLDCCFPLKQAFFSQFSC